MTYSSETLLLLQLIEADGRNVSIRLAEARGISRQAASARIRAAIREGLVQGSGRGPGVFYSLKPLRSLQETFHREGLSEDRIWSRLIAPEIRPLPENVEEIWQYGITEMVNNGIDHSEAAEIAIKMEQDALRTTVWIYDNGVGIFKRIQEALSLEDPREAILELAKGKCTTDPSRHSGEGIFFSSKLFDQFQIQSGPLQWIHHAGFNEALLERENHEAGTTVMMRLSNDAPTVAREVFNKFAKPDEFTFAKTLVPIRLAQDEGDGLVSRSQAKRLVFRFEKFETVILDFEGVKMIGQAFADEIFRVFQGQHPTLKLVPVNMNERVKEMVSRAKSHRA